MRTGIVILCGIVLLALALVAMAPASLVESQFAKMTNNRVQIANAQGRLWNGSGELILPTGERKPVVWSIDMLPLLRGELRGTLGGDAQSATPFAFGDNRAELGGFKLDLPAETLLRSAGLPYAAGGEVSLQVDRAIRDPNQLDVQVALQWHNASLGVLPSQVALGEVTTQLSGRGPQVSGPIANSGGEVEISGTLTAAAEGPPRIDMLIRPRAGLDRDRAAAIAGALSAVGSPDPQGAYRVSWPRPGR